MQNPWPPSPAHPANAAARGFIRATLVAVVLAWIAVLAPSAQAQQVILLARTPAQPTGTGKSLLKSLPRMLRSAIMEGTVPLYTDAYMQTKYSLLEISNLERVNGRRLDEANEFYIYEFWDGKGKNFKSYLAGFGLVHSIRADSAVTSFGYVDARDVTDRLRLMKLEADASTDYDRSAYDALMGHQYKFRLLQLGRKTFKEADAGAKALASAWKKGRPNPELDLQPTRLLVYSASASDTSQAARQVMGTMGGLLAAVPDLYNELTQREAPRGPKGKLARVEVMVRNSIVAINSDTISVQGIEGYRGVLANGEAFDLPANHGALAAYSPSETGTFNELMTAHAQSLDLVRINGQAIPAKQQAAYRQGLLQPDRWNDLNRYVLDNPNPDAQ